MFEKLKKWFGKKEEKLGAGVSKPYVPLSEEKSEIAEAAVALNDAVAVTEPRVVYAPKRDEAPTSDSVPVMSGTVTVEAPANATVDVKVEPPTLTVETPKGIVESSGAYIESVEAKIERLNMEAAKLRWIRRTRKAIANAKYRDKKAKKK